MRGLNVLILLAVAYVLCRRAEASEWNEWSEEEGHAGFGGVTAASTILGVLAGLRELV